MSSALPGEEGAWAARGTRSGEKCGPGGVEGDVLHSCTALGKCFWKRFCALPLSTCGVYLPGLVSPTALWPHGLHSQW